MPQSVSELLALLPELFLTTAALALLLYAAVVKREREARIAGLSIASLVVTLALLLVSAGTPLDTPLFGGMLAVDRFGLFFKAILILAAIVTIAFSLRFVGGSAYPGGEYHCLILFTTLGMMFMASSTHLASIYISLELMALSQYVLAGWFKRESKSLEAAAKYFVLGAFSSGVLLYGISLVYGATGTLSLSGIAAAIVRPGGPGDGASGAAAPAGPAGSTLLVVGVLLLLCGLFFKIASAPFHVWAPDVYEGAPTPIAAFFSVGPKLAAYAIFVRIFFSGFGELVRDWSTIVAVSAALTMVVGNVGALMQTNVKRLLGYSSIGHAGYALLGFLGYGTEFGAWSVLVYLLAYAFMNLGAFGLVVLLEAKGYAGESVDDFNGLAGKNPAAAAAMVVFLLSLAGIPPTAGFIGKYWLFSAAMAAGWAWLALLGVLMSAVSLFYYFRIVRAMYLVPGEGVLRWREEPAVSAAIAVCLFGTLAMGVLPQPFVALARTCLLP